MYCAHQYALLRGTDDTRDIGAGESPLLRRVSLFVPLDEDEERAVTRAAGGEPVTVVRRSLDARKGRPIGFHLDLEIGAPPEAEPEGERGDELPRARAGLRVVVVGSGPAGTFAADRLVR